MTNVVAKPASIIVIVTISMTMTMTMTIKMTFKAIQGNTKTMTML